MSLDKIILKLTDVLAKAKKKQSSMNNEFSKNKLPKELFIEINDLLEKVISRLEKK